MTRHSQPTDAGTTEWKSRERPNRALSAQALEWPSGWAKIRSHLGAAGYNIAVSGIPFHSVRQAWLRAVGMRLGERVCIMRGSTIVRPERISIGDGTVIGMDCFLGGEAGLTIGSNVNISSFAVLLGGRHDLNDPAFASILEPIEIEDYAWLATRVTVLGGVRVGRGAVVAAGAVVTKDVADYAVVGGVPAKKIGERNPDACVYQFNYQPWFF
ncbi:MAG: acyltransferase [Bryobacteraceae bacterium]